MWAWGDNRQGQLGTGLAAVGASESVCMRQVVAVSGRRVRSAGQLPRASSCSSPPPQSTAHLACTDYFLHFADNSSCWTAAVSCSRPLQLWLACNEQFVAAVDAVAQLNRQAESLLPMAPLTSASASSAPLVCPASSSLKMCRVAFSLQVYLCRGAAVPAWTNRVDADWIICEASVAASAAAASAAAASVTATSPLSFGGPSCPPLLLPPTLSSSSFLLNPLQSATPLRVQFTNPSPQSLSPPKSSAPLLSPAASVAIPSLPVFTSPRITHVSCGDRHVVVVDGGGGVWVWGCNADGQVGRMVSS